MVPDGVARFAAIHTEGRKSNEERWNDGILISYGRRKMPAAVNCQSLITGFVEK